MGTIIPKICKPAKIRCMPETPLTVLVPQALAGIHQRRDHALRAKRLRYVSPTDADLSTASPPADICQPAEAPSEAQVLAALDALKRARGAGGTALLAALRGLRELFMTGTWQHSYAL